MGYGKKGWFKTYITMMKNSFEYAKNSVSKHEHWVTRGLALLFAIIWYIFTIVIFILLPFSILLIVLKLVGVI